MNRMSRNSHFVKSFSVLFLASMPALLQTRGLLAADEKPKPKGSEVQIAKVSWLELDKSGHLPKAAKLDKDTTHGDVLKIVRTAEVPQLIEIATIDKPAATKRAYMLRGKVKFEGVSGEGFLEIWNHFPEPKKGAYFSRTMAETGSMGKLRGDSPWKDFVLPFNFDDATFPMPEKIQFNVYLPQSGTVWLSDLELVEFPPSELMKQVTGASAFGFGTWMTIMVTIVLGFAIGLGVLLAGLAHLRAKQAQGIELRRMQAMDIG